jgi:hypothetical protein
MSEEYGWDFEVTVPGKRIEVDYPPSDYDDMVLHAEASGFTVLRFEVRQFNETTYQVIDIERKVEVCVCFDVPYENQDCPAKVRAQAISDVLNATRHKPKHLGIPERKVC